MLPDTEPTKWPKAQYLEVAQLYSVKSNEMRCEPTQVCTDVPKHITIYHYKTNHDN